MLKRIETCEVIKDVLGKGFETVLMEGKREMKSGEREDKIKLSSEREGRPENMSESRELI